MKLIKLETHGNWTTKAIIMMVMNHNPRGMQLDEMRRRISIMDAMDGTDVNLVLKDEEFRFVVDAMKGYPFGVAHKDLLAVIDGVIDSEDAPAPMQAKPKKNGKSEHAAPAT